MVIIFEFVAFVFCSLLALALCFLLVRKRLNSKFSKIGILLFPFVLHVFTWTYMTFISYEFRLGDYDHSRIALKYPYEIVDGELGTFLRKVDNARSDQFVVPLYNKLVIPEDSALYFRDIHPDSICWLHSYKNNTTNVLQCTKSELKTVGELIREGYQFRLLVLTLVCIIELISIAILFLLFERSKGKLAHKY